MAASSEALNDRDLYLSYLRSYVYDDPLLVAALLEPANDELRASEKIANRINDRFRQLVSFADLEARVELWVASAQQGAVDPEARNATNEDHARASRLFNEALVADAQTPEGEKFATWMLMTLEERSLCFVGATPVYVEPSTTAGDLNVLLSPGREPCYTIQDRAAPAHGEGELELVATSNAHAMMVLLCLDQEVLLVSSFGDHSEEELVLAKRHVANRPISESIYQDVRVRLEEDGVVSTVWNIVMTPVSKAFDAVYGPLCTLNAKEQDWRRAFKALKRGGVFCLLNGDAELTRALASIGLVNSFSTHCNIVRMIGRLLGVDESALEKALNLDTANGIRMVARKGESVMALV